MEKNCPECLRLAHCKYIQTRDLCVDIKDLGNDTFKNDQFISASESCSNQPVTLKLNSRAEANNSSSTQASTVRLESPVIRP